MKTKPHFVSCVIVVTATLVTTSLSLVAQDFTVRMKADDGYTSTIYVSPTAVRKTSDQSDIIDRIDRSTVIYLNHARKTYSEMPIDELRKAVDRKMGNLTPKQQELMHSTGLDAAPVLTELGPGENIAGYPTERYSVKTAMAQAEMWVTQSLQFPAAYYTDFHLFGQTGAIGGLTKIAEVHGVVLKRATTMTGRGSTPGRSAKAVVETAEVVDKAPIPASTFEPPNGYTKASR